VAQLVKGDNPPINGYLDQLAKLKAKVASIASTDEPVRRPAPPCRPR
jgi:type VI secretion system protein ImpL